MQRKGLILLVCLCGTTALQAQERPLPAVTNDTTAQELQIVPLTEYPMEYSMQWLREATDPIYQERLKLHSLMQQRANQSVILKPNATVRDLNKEAGLWRFSIGNTSMDNWSQFPDRALDARTLRFPLPRNMSPDNRPEHIQRLDKLKK